MSNFRLAQRAVNASADAVVAQLSGGTVSLYDGPQPSSADRDVAPRSVLLVTLQLNDPAFFPAEGGEAEARPIQGARSVAGGTPRWFRARAVNGEQIFDGDVGLEDSGADLEMAAVSIPAGVEVLIASWRYRQPQAERRN